MKQNLKTALNNVPFLNTMTNTQVLLNESQKRGRSNQNMDRSVKLLAGIQTISDELLSKNSGMTHTEINNDLYEKIRIVLNDLTNIQKKMHGEKIKSMNNSLRVATKLANMNDQASQNFLMALCDNNQEVYNSVKNGAHDSSMPLQYALFEQTLSNELLVALVKILTDRVTSNVDEQSMVNIYYKLCTDLLVHKDNPNLRKVVEDNMQQEIVNTFEDDPALMDALEKCKRNQFTGFTPSGLAPNVINYTADLNKVYNGSVNPSTVTNPVYTATVVPNTATYGNVGNVNYGNTYTGSIGGGNVANTAPNYSATTNNQTVTPSSSIVTAGSSLNIADIVNRAYENQNVANTANTVNYSATINPTPVYTANNVNTGYTGSIRGGSITNTAVSSVPQVGQVIQTQQEQLREVVDTNGNRLLIDNNNVIRQVIQNTNTANVNAGVPIYGGGTVQNVYTADPNELRVDRILHNQSNVLNNNTL